MILKHTKCTESTKKEQEEQNFLKVRLIKNFGPGIHQTLVDLNSNFIHPMQFSAFIFTDLDPRYRWNPNQILKLPDRYFNPLIPL